VHGGAEGLEGALRRDGGRHETVVPRGVPCDLPFSSLKSLKWRWVGEMGLMKTTFRRAKLSRASRTHLGAHVLQFASALAERFDRRFP
jgi:hypothetical protein